MLIMTVIALLLFGLWLTPLSTAMSVPQAAEELEVHPETAIGPVKIVELSHSLQNGIPIFYDIFKGMETIATVPTHGYYMNRMNMTEHTSTHMDAPAHFIDGGWTIDQIPFERLYGVCVVMDARKYVAHPNDTITAEEIMAWEEETGITIPEGGILFVYTGWEDYWGVYDTWEEYWDACGYGWPGLSKDAAHYLVEKGVIGVGIDTLSLDPAPSTTFPFHQVFLGANGWQIENLCRLKDLANKVCFVLIFPMKIGDGSGAPCRVWAFYDPEQESVKMQFLLANLLKMAFDAAIKYDLSWSVQNGIPIFFDILRGITVAATVPTHGYYMLRMVFTEHTSTHMDAPTHFAPMDGNMTIDELPLDVLFGRAVVMDMRWAISHPNDTVTKAELEAWVEATGIVVDEGDIVVVYTGWGDYWGTYNDWSEYWAVTGGGFPGFAEDASEFFLERGVVGVCIDTLSIDPAPSTAFEFHHAWLPRNKWALENIKLYDGHPLLNSTCYMFLAPWMVKDGSGGPTRVWALKNFDLTTPINTYLAIKEEVKSLKSKVDELEELQSLLNTSLSQLNTTLNQLRSRIEDLEATVSDLQGMLDELETSLTEIETTVEDLKSAVKDLSARLGGIKTTAIGVGAGAFVGAVVLSAIISFMLVRKK